MKLNRIGRTGRGIAPRSACASAAASAPAWARRGAAAGKGQTAAHRRPHQGLRRRPDAASPPAAQTRVQQTYRPATSTRSASTVSSRPWTSGRLDKGAKVNAAALKAAGIIRRTRGWASASLPTANSRRNLPSRWKEPQRARGRQSRRPGEKSPSWARRRKRQRRRKPRRPR